MSVVLVGMMIGALLGSLLTAAYLGSCLKEQEQQSNRDWIDKAIARAFSAVEESVLEDLPPQL
ncbi:MAG: hypothetical protein BMS9Abin28_0543 [Anaerolineae bacterium]|nr:MAG: hypothetical protein BMS9Abin28_0543 [Anaerolineae bacterium]